MTDRDRAHKFLLEEMEWHEWEARIALLAAEFAAIREQVVKTEAHLTVPPPEGREQRLSKP